MISWTDLYVWIDSVLISFFRIGGPPVIGYYVGTGLVCLLCVVLGQLTLATVFLYNRRTIDEDNSRMVHMHNLSLKALLVKDKIAYKCCNKEANEAFGKVFFSQIALSISSLWPVPFALAWMQTRFGGVTFALPLPLPLIGATVGYLFTALPIYVLVYILFGRVKHRLPFFNKMAMILKAYDAGGDESPMRLAELAAKAVQPAPPL